MVCNDAGRNTVLRLVQSSKAPVPMSVTPSGMTMLVTAVPASIYWLMADNSSGRVMLVKRSASAKAASPIMVTLLGICTSVTADCQNALGAMEVTS